MLARVLLMLMGIWMPLPALATDVHLSLNGSTQYDSNTDRNDSGGVGDFSFRVGPIIQVSDDIQRFSYQLRYSPIYQKFIEQDDFDKLSHFAGARLNYQIGNKTHLALTEHFSLTQSINQQSLGVQPEDVEGSPRTETRRGDVLSNIARFEMRHSFTPRISGQFTATHQFFDSDNENTSKNTSLGGLASLTYAAGARDRVGLGGGVTFQQFEETRGQPASDTYTYRVFASWLHNFGESTELSIRAGPALISTQQDRPDPGGIGQQFPNLVVGPGGLIADGIVTDLSGNTLMIGSMIPAGSLLVPDTCPFTELPSGFEINPSNCAFSRVAFPGVDDAFIGDIQTGSVNFAFLPGEDPGSTSDSTLTYFGEFSLSHSWTAKLSSSLEYSRSDSSASSLGSATVADRVTFHTRWKPSQKLNLSLRADWVQRKSANEISNTFRTVSLLTQDGLNPCPTPAIPSCAVGYSGGLRATTDDNSVDTTYYGVSALASYRYSRRTTLSARLTFQKQDTTSASTSSSSDFGDVVVFLGLRYEFDPFHF